MAIIYLNKAAVIYPDETPNLLELENQRGIQFSYPEIFKRLGGITREAINRPIYPGVNREPQVKVKKGWHTSGARPVLLK